MRSCAGEARSTSTPWSSYAVVHRGRAGEGTHMTRASCKSRGRGHVTSVHRHLSGRVMYPESRSLRRQKGAGAPSLTVIEPLVTLRSTRADICRPSDALGEMTAGLFGRSPYNHGPRIITSSRYQCRSPHVHLDLMSGCLMVGNLPCPATCSAGQSRRGPSSTPRATWMPSRRSRPSSRSSAVGTG